MKRILVFIYLVVLMGLAYSQAPEWEWVVTGSGTGSSAINDVVSADNGNKYITGRYSGSCSLGNFDISSAQSSGFVACLDSSNVFQWVFPFELNNSHAHKPHITYTSDGYIYVAAYYLNSITIQDTVYPNAGSYDILLLKLDTSGQLIDCSVWGGSGDDYVYDIASDDMGNVYLCGQSTSTLLQFGDFSFISHASTDAFVVKVDSEGAVEWLSQAWSSAADYFYSIDIQGDEFCVSGSHGKTPSMNFGSIQVVSNYNWSFDGETDAIVAKGSISEGEWLWATDIENVQWNSYRCYVQDAKFDSNHNIIIAGLFPGVIVVGDYALGPYGDNCGTHFVASYNVSGECTWARAFGSNSAMSFPDMMRVAIDSRDNAFCTFYYYGTNYFNTVNIASLGSYDGFICKVNDSGEVQWAKSVAGIGTESAKSIIDSNDELLVFGGFTSQPTYWDSYTANATGGTEHFYIGKLDNTVPDFSVSSTSGYLPLTVQFTNESTGFPTSYQWDFDGNGIIDSTEPNPVFTYTQPGTYSVSLTTSDGIHFRTKTQSNLINAILRPDTDWLTALAFGGLGVDSITDLTHDTEGNVYVTGSFTESVVVEDITYYSQGQYDIFVAKYNSAGQCLWFRPAGGNGDENSNRIYLDTFNNLFIVGSFMSSSFNFPGLTPLSGPGINSSNIVYAYVAKLDTEGNWLWHIGAHSTGSGLCKVNDLCVDNDGSLYIAGAYWININFGVFSYSGSNSYDSFIAKFSSSGSFLWSTNLTGSNSQFVNSIAMSHDDNIVVSGHIIGLSTFGPGTFSLTPYGGIDVFVGKVNSDTGAWLWVRKGGGTGDEISAWSGGLACSSDGSIYLSLDIQSQLSNWGDLPVLSLNGTSKGAYVAKMSGDGNWLWLHGNRLSTATANNIIVTSDGYSYYTGSFQGRTFFDDFQLDSQGSDDIFVTKLDPQGCVVWAMSAGGTGSDSGAGLTIDTDGAMYACGTFNGTAVFQNTSLTSTGGQDGFIAKIELVKCEFMANLTSGRVPLTVCFTDQSVGIIDSWAWDLDNDGSVDSFDQNPSWAYNQVGFYTVSLTVTSGSVTETVTKEHYIHVYLFDTDFTADLTLGYVPLTVNFTDTTEGTIILSAWDFNSDGVTDASGSSAIWTYIFPGVYNVSLTDSDVSGSEIETKQDYITVSLNPAITHYVPTDYLTIQAAINASVDGDYIIVADGTYFENLLIEGKSITLASYYFVDGDSSHITNTIIDGSNAINPDQASTITILPSSGRTISQPHISGFTIRSGSGRRIIQNEGGTTIEKRVGGGIYTRSANPIFSFNRIEDNDADDEGGGSYAFQSLPNFGGIVNATVGIRNPGVNSFRNNHADIGSDIYIQGITSRDEIKIQDCSFEVFSSADTTLSNYWATSSAPLSFSGCGGLAEAITADIWVATNGSDTLNDGLSPLSPFKTIDHALSRIYATAENPLVIHIASGTYSPSLTGEKFPLQMVKHVSLRGSGREETFLDAEGSADFPRRVLNLDKVEGVQVSGLTLMNGFVTLAKNYNGGAIGILASQVALSDLIVAGSSAAGNGAGIYALDSSVEADSLVIQYNSALGSGGGIHSVQTNLNLSQSSVINNSVSKNGAGLSLDGGAIAVNDCEISYNQATGYQSKGGGISLSGTQNALFKANLITHNNADNGAGAYLQDNSAFHLDRNRFTNNLADYSGGGLFINTSSGLITNNLIAGNTASQRGGALYCYSAPLLINNTIASNKAGLQGGALYLNSASPSVTNTILWGNVQGNPEVPNQIYLFGDAADPEITFSDVQGGYSAFGSGGEASYTGTYLDNQDQDPLFTDTPEGAGHYFEIGQASLNLSDESPAIDAGDPGTDFALFPLDIACNPRLDSARVDLGAWEAVHFVGARIAANPPAIDFGRVNISGEPVQQQISLSNTGNQALLISDITLETPATEFSWTFSDIGSSILPGESLILEASFDPQQVGLVSNTLLLSSNSLNSPVLRIPLRGYGIDASSSQPSNVVLQVSGYDVNISWDPVLSDPLGNPFTPEGYIVLYSETINATLDDYLYLTFSTGTSAVHTAVARFQDRMFYRVIAVDGSTRSTLENLLSSAQRTRQLSWREIKLLLQNRGTTIQTSSSILSKER